MLLFITLIISTTLWYDHLDESINLVSALMEILIAHR